MRRFLFNGLGAVALSALLFGTASAAEKTSFNAFGVHMTIEVSNAQTNGLSSTIRTVVPAGGGPPMAHIHTREDETYIVLRGQFRFWHGTHVVDAGPGTVVFLPRNEPHQFRNVGTTSGELLFTFTPGTLENFFIEAGKRHFEMPKDMQALVQLSKRYGITYVGSLSK